MKHLELQEKDDRDQHLEMRHEIKAQRPKHEQGVEIDAAEVCPEASPFA